MSTFIFNPDTTRYESQNAFWLGKAASLAYQDEPTVWQETSVWGFDKFRFFSKRETQAFVIANDKMIITAFRGTEPTQMKDWMTDVDIALVDGLAASCTKDLTGRYPMCIKTSATPLRSGKEMDNPYGLPGIV